MSVPRVGGLGSGLMNRAIPMAAGILALVAGAYQVGCIPLLLHTASIYSDTFTGPELFTTSFHRFVVWWLTTEAAVSFVAALALILGGGMVIAAKSLGRGFIIIGCLMAVVNTGVGWVIVNNIMHRFAEIGAEDYAFQWFNMPGRLVIVLPLVAVPVITAMLALLPATRRWCHGTPTGDLATETGAAQTDPAQTAETD
jgi:hypothetical protein